jgi:hypothetical protein
MMRVVDIEYEKKMRVERGLDHYMSHKELILDL